MPPVMTFLESTRNAWGCKWDVLEEHAAAFHGAISSRTAIYWQWHSLQRACHVDLTQWRSQPSCPGPCSSSGVSRDCVGLSWAYWWSRGRFIFLSAFARKKSDDNTVYGVVAGYVSFIYFSHNKICAMFMFGLMWRRPRSTTTPLTPSIWMYQAYDEASHRSCHQLTYVTRKMWLFDSTATAMIRKHMVGLKLRSPLASMSLWMNACRSSRIRLSVFILLHWVNCQLIALHTAT